MQNITLSNYINSFTRALSLGLLSMTMVPLQIDAAEIEEIIVKASYREIALEKNDGSLLVLNEDQLKAEPIKHLEQLSFLVPNLNFALSDGRPRYFQIRGIGEQSGYEGTPNSSVGLMIDDIDFSYTSNPHCTVEDILINMEILSRGYKIGKFDEFLYSTDFGSDGGCSTFRTVNEVKSGLQMIKKPLPVHVFVICEPQDGACLSIPAILF